MLSGSGNYSYLQLLSFICRYWFLLQDQKSSSITKRKLRVIICLITLFTLIIASIVSASIILKQKTDSQSLSFNPTKAITAVCDLISEDPYSCFDSITALHNSQILKINPTKIFIPALHNSQILKINPTKIFILSHYASKIELENVASLLEEAISEVDVDPKSVGVLRNCKGMVEFSLKQINESEVSLGIDPGEKILGVNKVVWDLQRWIGEAMGQVERCVDLLDGIPLSVRLDIIKEKIYVAQQKLRDSRGILRKVDDIFQLFYPTIGSALHIVWEYEYGLTVWVFCFGYLILILLFCLLLRVY